MSDAALPTLFVILVFALTAGGCSAPWRAPVESRSGAAGRDTQQPIEGPEYRVQSGDTLYGIAWRAGSDYHDLARWNDIKAPYRIYVGQRLQVAPPASPTTRPTSTTTHRPGSSAPPVATSEKQPPRPFAPTKPVKQKKSDSSAERASGSLRWAWPTRGPLLQGFSSTDATRKGIKVGGKKGQPILAAEAGEVVYSGSGLVGYGELIIIKHNSEYLSAYGHNSKRLVKEGQHVARGAKIAEMGLAGGRPVLHFEIRQRGKPVNPVTMLPRP